ncbi:NADPH HC-toxin reductase 1 isoform X2 [Aegilops tauschii subsp. strangulata]|nr:putative anthocyanidin reductase isoform X2 [Aegilops tauschii subsp. strangulata]
MGSNISSETNVVVRDHSGEPITARRGMWIIPLRLWVQHVTRTIYRHRIPGRQGIDKRIRPEKMSRVCVTGAAGYIASWLVKKLLDRGCTVHGTVRNLGDETKTGLLRGLPGAAERLVLFEADIYDAASFEPAIQGCEFVFLVATPLQHNSGSSKAYVSSKTISEEELLKYNDDFSKDRAFDVVVLLCGLVGGDILLPHISGSIHVMLSPLTGVKLHHNSLKSLQTLLGSIPLVHINDVCEAHIFCMERSFDVAGGRYLCTTAHTNMHDVLEHYAGKHPELEIVDKEVVGEGVRVHVNTNKLVELGFKYKYGAKEVLDGSVDCGKRLGVL